MLGLLAQDGLTITPDASEADAVVINTCGFLEASKTESLKEIRDEVHELNANWSRSREVQPWTRGQKIAAFGVGLTALLSLGSLLVTLIVASGAA